MMRPSELTKHRRRLDHARDAQSHARDDDDDSSSDDQSDSDSY
jgi:hypothetical protein